MPRVQENQANMTTLFSACSIFLHLQASEQQVIDTTGSLSPLKTPETNKEGDDTKSFDCRKTATPNVSEIPTEDVPEKVNYPLLA